MEENTGQEREVFFKVPIIVENFPLLSALIYSQLLCNIKRDVYGKYQLMEPSNKPFTGILETIAL